MKLVTFYVENADFQNAKPVHTKTILCKIHIVINTNETNNKPL